MTTTKFYQKTIADILKDLGRSDIDPRHIEAGMRLGHSTIGHFSEEQIIEEVRYGIRFVDESGEIQAELTAQSFGL